MNDNTLGSRIRKLRKKNYMSQAELAKKIGVSASAIGMYEQNRRTPDNDTLREFCEIFGVTSDYLLGLSLSSERKYDVSEVLDDYSKKLSEQESLMFDGEPLNEDERKQVLQTIEYVARLAERLSTDAESPT